MELSASDQKILLVEDHPATLRVMEMILGNRGFITVSAKNVTEALALAEENRIAFVVSDIGLPDGNGHDLMVVLKERYGLTGVAVSAYNDERTVEKSFACGFINHFPKPLRIDRLIETLAEHGFQCPE